MTKHKNITNIRVRCAKLANNWRTIIYRTRYQYNSGNAISDKLYDALHYLIEIESWKE